MGYAFMLGKCMVCERSFYFNPVRVPSFRDSEGVRQPVCHTCILQVNDKRVELGLDAFVIPVDAYEPCDESELG